MRNFPLVALPAVYLGDSLGVTLGLTVYGDRRWRISVGEGPTNVGSGITYQN